MAFGEIQSLSRLLEETSTQIGFRCRTSTQIELHWKTSTRIGFRQQNRRSTFAKSNLCRGSTAKHPHKPGFPNKIAGRPSRNRIRVEVSKENVDTKIRLHLPDVGNAALVPHAADRCCKSDGRKSNPAVFRRAEPPMTTPPSDNQENLHPAMEAGFPSNTKKPD